VTLPADRRIIRPTVSWSQAWTILACLWIVAASLLPDLSTAGPFNLRPEDIITIVMVALGTYELVARGRRPDTGVLKCIALAAGALALIGAIGMTLSHLTGRPAPDSTFGHGLFVETLKEYARLAKYVLVALAFGFVPSRAWKLVLATLAFCCSVLVGIQLLQYAGFVSVTNWILVAYAKGDRIFLTSTLPRYKGFGWGWRSGSLLVNPNVLGSYLLAPLVLFTMSVFRPAGRRAWWGPIAWLGLTSLVWLGIYLSQSRTALIAGLIASVFGLALAAMRTRLSLKSILLLAGPFVAVMIFGSLTLTTSPTRFNPRYIGHALSTNWLAMKWLPTLSALSRYSPWHLLAGAGPALSGQMDSELGYILVWYGLLGVLALIGLYLSLGRLIRHRAKDPYAGAALLATIAASAVGSLAASYFLNNRIFPLYIALLSVACASSTPTAESSMVQGADSEPA